MALSWGMIDFELTEVDRAGNKRTFQGFRWVICICEVVGNRDSILRRLFCSWSPAFST